jgi:hypothetical protein
MQMRIEYGQLEPVCKARFRVAGVADEDPGAFEPRSFADHFGFTLRAMKRYVGFEQFS